MGDQANFIVTHPNSPDPSPKRINNIDPLGDVSCRCVRGSMGGGGGPEGSGVSDNLPLDMSMNQLGRALEREI